MRIHPPLRKALQERAGACGDRIYCCEICGKPGNNAHHRKNKSQGGADVLSNLLLLCGSGTTGCHGYVTAPFKNSQHWPRRPKPMGWSVWRSDDPAKVPVYYRGRWCRLDDTGHVILLTATEISKWLG